MAFFAYKPYVPVALRKEKALRKLAKLQKQGLKVQPLLIPSKKIATSFWGKAWCEHIESLSDYTNRLPRGRTYVRNGSVCHLAIEPGCVTAIVAGSEVYHITIKIKTLANAAWQTIKDTCAGQISSLLDLLSGKLSDGVMQIVCNKDNGLLPLPKEINLSCSCPDWATMCKHVAAVLYAIGTRLDLQPEQLFALRGVNHAELVDVTKIIAVATKEGKSTQRRLANVELDKMFNIDLIQEAEPTKIILPKTLTGNAISKKRNALQLNKSAFAKALGVSIASISKWENMGRKKVILTAKSLTALQKIWDKG